MFDFFDTQKNPFMAMMNPTAAEGEAQSGDSEPQAQPSMEPMQFMQQALLMQMQMAQMMWMMPFQLLQGMASMTKTAPAAGEQAAPQQEGFKLGGLNVPPELLNRLMSMDMTPENLDKLQKVLDFVFAAMPEEQDD